MRRAWVLLVPLAAASCAAGAGSSGDARSPAESTAGIPPDDTVPSTTVDEPVPTGTEAPVESPPREDFASSFDVATDPFAERQNRPRLATDPVETWSIDIARVTVPFAEAFGDVVVLHTISPDNDQAIVGFDRTDGSLAWSFEPDGTIGLVGVVGDRVLVTLPRGEETDAVLLDGASGQELPLPSDHNFGRRGRYIEASTTGSCNARYYDPASGELVGEFCPVGAGPATFVGSVGDSVVEVDPLDFRTVSDPIPIDQLSEQRRVMVFGDTVVAYSLSALEFLDRTGGIVTSIPDPGDLMLTPAGMGSDVLIVYDHDRAFGLDVRTLSPIWERPMFVAPFGVVDGEAVGATRPQATSNVRPSTEVFSLDTGETKCVIDAEVDVAQNGFYEPDGVAYDLDCVVRWEIDVADDAEIHIIDSSVVTVTPTDDGTTEIRYLS